MEDLSQLSEGQLIAMLGSERDGPKKQALLAELEKRMAK